jgi:hypothetical protein
VYVLNYTPNHEDVRRGASIAPRIVNMGSKWTFSASRLGGRHLLCFGWEVVVTPKAIYTLGENTISAVMEILFLYRPRAQSLCLRYVGSNNTVNYF